jgi:hypothetical protein
MKIAYLPFGNDDELLNMTRNVVRSFHRGALSLFQEQFHQTILVSDGVSKVLKKVRTGQQLYVFCHGDTGADAIFDSNGGQMSVDDLAWQLDADGLSTGHRVIKLWACRGGAGPNSTAAQFKQALRNQGFNNVTVYGYTQDLWSDTKGVLASKQAGNSDDFADAVRAKNVRVRY